MRIYVLITSFEPLRIYVFQEGLTRFASEPYSSGTKFNKFSHLTNYSINKKNANFVQNQDLEHDDFGFKWSLSALCGHLEQIGIDMDLLWSKIYDLIIKSIIAAEDKIQAGLNKYCTHKTNCFEILGFDVLIDSELKPWLLEANLAPSLSSDSPLDFKIKSNLITDAFNLVGIKKYDRRKESVNKIKHRMKGLYARGKSLNNRYGNNFSYKDGSKYQMKSFLQASNSKDIETELVRYLQGDTSLAVHRSIVKSIIPMKFKEILKTALLENSRRGNFIRIYPAKGTDIYDQYFKSVRPYNVFLYKCLFTDEVFPLSVVDTLGEIPPLSLDPGLHSHEGVQRDVKPNADSIQKAKKPQRPQTVKVGSNPSMKATDPNEKIIITGDDVLIEYVQRILNALALVSEDNLSADIRLGIDKFILHYVWHSKDPAVENPNISLSERLQVRYEEMKQRRKRLVRSILKREGKLDSFEANYKKLSQQKMTVLKNFNGNKLEDMLKTSTKNVAQEVVSILINHSRDCAYGILPDLEINFLHCSKETSYFRNHEESQDIDGEAEDDERVDEDIPCKQYIASSVSGNLNKYSNTTGTHELLANQPHRLPPTVNYNNYFNKANPRQNSNIRKAVASNSITTTHSDSRSKIQNIKRCESTTQNKTKDFMLRRDSNKTENDSKVLRVENMTSRQTAVQKCDSK